MEREKNKECEVELWDIEPSGREMHRLLSLLGMIWCLRGLRQDTGMPSGGIMCL